MGRSWLGLLGVSSLALLSGCGWFDGGPPAGSAKLRPGADRQIQASGALPSGNPGQQYEQGISAADETRGQQPQIGSIVAAKGGQKAQREAADKEAAERDAKAREARLEREAAEKEAKAKEGAQARAARTVDRRTARQARRRRTRQSGWRDEGDTGAGSASGRTAVQFGAAANVGALRRNARRRHGQFHARCHARRDDERAGRAAASAASA